MSNEALGIFEAVVFDLDGVIVDSQRLHAREEHALLAARGILIPEIELTQRFSGVTMHDMLTVIFREHGYYGSVDEAVTEKRERINSLPDAEFEPIPGAPELISALHRAEVSMAVASASGLPFINRMLRLTGLTDCFYTLASSRELLPGRGKPAPDVYLLAAKRLKVKPQACLAIEDGSSGMQAAYAAQMQVIGFVQPHLFQPEVTYPAHVVCPTMKKIKTFLGH